MGKKITDYKSLSGFETKAFPTFIKEVDDAQGVVSHFVAIFGNIDDGDDVIMPGAFRKTIAERGRRVKVLDQHQSDSALRVVGRPLALREVGRSELTPEVLHFAEDATGALLATTQYALDTKNGLDMFNLIKGGFLPETSIGYDAIDVSYEKRKQADGSEKTVRLLKELRLWEYSNVIWGMNPATATVSAKEKEATKKMEAKPYDVFEEDGEFCIYKIDADGNKVGEVLYCHPTADDAWGQIAAIEANEDKGANGAANLPLASRDRAWDATAAERRVRTWANAEDGPNAKYRRAFFWYDEDAPTNFGSYKMPFADVIDGELNAVYAGISAAAGALSGARGQTVNIPDADKAQVETRINRYYARMRDDFEDESITSPFEKDKADDGPDEDKMEMGQPRQLGNSLQSAVYGIVSYKLAEYLEHGYITTTELAALSNNAISAIRELATGLPDELLMRECGVGDYYGYMSQNPLSEEKAGRVISKRNAERLQRILQELQDIFNDAGLDNVEPDDGIVSGDEDEKNKSKDNVSPADQAETEAGPTSKSPTALDLLGEEHELLLLTMEV